MLGFWVFMVVMEVMSGKEERERKREKLERDINIFYCVNILF